MGLGCCLLFAVWGSCGWVCLLWGCELAWLVAVLVIGFGGLFLCLFLSGGFVVLLIVGLGFVVWCLFVLCWFVGFGLVVGGWFGVLGGWFVGF